MRDDAMDAGVVTQLLSQGADGVEGQDHGIQGIDPLVRFGRGMGGLAKEFDSDAISGQCQATEQIAASRMDHHRCVHRLKHSRLDHEHLAAAALLRRRADHLHRARQFR